MPFFVGSGARLGADLIDKAALPVGRMGLSAERVLRCLLLKQQLRISYKQLAFHLSDSVTCRFCLAGPPHAQPGRPAVNHPPYQTRHPGKGIPFTDAQLAGSRCYLVGHTACRQHGGSQSIPDRGQTPFCQSAQTGKVSGVPDIQCQKDRDKGHFIPTCSVLHGWS